MSSTSSKCQEGITASLGYLALEAGQLSVPTDNKLLDTLAECLSTFVNIFALEDEEKALSSPSTLETVLKSIFDNENEVFVMEDSLLLVEGLSDQERLSLFLQAVTGMAMVFQHLSLSGATMTPSALERELEIFSEGDERHEMLEKVEASRFLTACYDKKDLGVYLMKIVEDEDEEEDITPENHNHNLVTSWSATKQTINTDSDEWDSSRPCKNMGLPWGFTILALN
ncbi:hypothetical protein QBC37DRAFT_414622 [Rhypophila decipiens]|uniref:Uncharacterized protein n=1 Tax=Rhypophila decipiens TaxID=261697 RepID=A0AAN7BBR0_9PEZI|nr:hypothetical protein QBC37DRAFT_414622 [Rhypophila decipiens]